MPMAFCFHACGTKVSLKGNKSFIGMKQMKLFDAGNKRYAKKHTNQPGTFLLPLRVTINER